MEITCTAATHTQTQAHTLIRINWLSIIEKTMRWRWRRRQSALNSRCPPADALKKNGCPKDIEFFKFLAITYMIASSENSQQVKAQNIKESFGASSLETGIFSPVNSYFSLDKQSNYGFLTNWSNWITPSSCNHKITYSIGVTIDWIDWLIFLKNSMRICTKACFFQSKLTSKKACFFQSKVTSLDSYSHICKGIRSAILCVAHAGCSRRIFPDYY